MVFNVMIHCDNCNFNLENVEPCEGKKEAYVGFVIYNGSKIMLCACSVWHDYE